MNTKLCHFVALAAVGIVALGCSSPKIAEQTPVSSLPGIGDFGDYVSIAPTTQKDPNFQFYKVSAGYGSARHLFYDTMWKSGWHAKSHVQDKQISIDTYEKQGFGRYILSSKQFDGPNTCTLGYSPPYATSSPK